jgi:hypothetical protein
VFVYVFLGKGIIEKTAESVGVGPDQEVSWLLRKRACKQ